jgi:hypothetical protein
MTDGGQRSWLIRGYGSTELIFEDRVAVGLLSDRQLEELLQRLTAKAALTYDEIIDASVRRGSKRRSMLLDVQRDNRTPDRYVVTCGDNPYFVASLDRGVPSD